MSQDADQDSPETEESDEKQLCLSCAAPNEASAHFCIKCGAPLTSYASTGPLESVFAEGAVYRQAAERPRSLIVVVGIWLIFGMMFFAGVFALTTGGFHVLPFLLGGFFLVVSVIMICKTTKNYLSRKQEDENDDTDPSPPTPAAKRPGC